LVTILFVLTAIGIISTSVGNYNQCDQIESYKIIDDEIKLSEERSEDIKSQMYEILVEKYPTHEKNIYENLSGPSASIYLVKYPEMHTHETFKLYSNTLKELEDDIYDKKLNKLSIMKNINVRKRNIGLFQYFIPTIDK